MIELLETLAAPRTLPGFERLFAEGACRGKLLLVDDDHGVREILEFYLRREGYFVRTADNGLECVKKALTMRPDLIILNYLMPIMNGLTALREIKRNPSISYLKVVVYSAVGEDSPFWKAALDAGAIGCLHTPFDLRQFLAIVEKALRSR